MKKIEETEAFLNVYREFDKWLTTLGFEQKPANTQLDFHYSEYDNILKSLYAVEHYVNERLGFSIRFLRGRDVHAFVEVGGFGRHSDVYPLENFKEILKEKVISLRDEKLKELEFFNWLTKEPDTHEKA